MAIAGAVGGGAGWLGARAMVAQLDPVPDATRGWQTLGRLGASGIVERSFDRARRAERDPAALPVDVLTVQFCERDSDGLRLRGSSRYMLRFAASDAPQVDAFWALSVLDARGVLFTGGARTSLTSRSGDLVRNRDGSLDIVIAESPPEEPTANWLPVPPGPFRVVLRNYLPRDAGAGAKRPPAVNRRETTA